jgi:IS30 family transposase
MSYYNQLSIDEREIILKMLCKGKNKSAIAQELGRSASTIGRELRRNGKTYSAHKAQKSYLKRRKKCRPRKRLEDAALREKVIQLLGLYWSPEQISNRLKAEKSPIQIGCSTIYRGIYAKMLPEGCLYQLRIRGRRYYGRKKNSRCGKLSIEYTIHDRPKEVNLRQVYGHWESDTVRGTRNTGCIGTHVERKSRYCVLLKLENRSTKSFITATTEAFMKIPAGKCHSFTVDHGKEFSGHRKLAKALNCKVYFADPNCPNQRGTNENTNGLLRQFAPKRRSFSNITQADVDRIAHLLNTRPRKCLNWKTPYEVFFDRKLHLT